MHSHICKLWSRPQRPAHNEDTVADKKAELANARLANALKGAPVAGGIDKQNAHVAMH